LIGSAPNSGITIDFIASFEQSAEHDAEDDRQRQLFGRT
jgi:hypothetical protein